MWVMIQLQVMLIINNSYLERVWKFSLLNLFVQKVLEYFITHYTQSMKCDTSLKLNIATKMSDITC